MLLVYELDGDDGLVGVFGAGLADEGVGALADGSGDDTEGKVCGKGGSFDLMQLSVRAQIVTWSSTTLTCEETTIVGRLSGMSSSTSMDVGLFGDRARTTRSNARRVPRFGLKSTGQVLR